jgi:hypothetical protein
MKHKKLSLEEKERRVDNQKKWISSESTYRNLYASPIGKSNQTIAFKIEIIV